MGVAKRKAQGCLKEEKPLGVQSKGLQNYNMVNIEDIRRWKFYNHKRKYGRVRWLDVAKRFGISMQTVWLSLRKVEALSEKDRAFLLKHGAEKGIEHLETASNRPLTGDERHGL